MICLAKEGSPISANLGEIKPLLEEFADGENAVVANDGKWVRESRIKEYNANPKANQDAVYNEEKEEELWNAQFKKEMLVNVSFQSP